MRHTSILTGLLCGGLFAASAFAASDDMATIVTQTSKPAECISRIAVRKIDGKEKFVSPQGFELEPGWHTLSGTAAIDARNCPVVKGNSNWNVAPLEAEFEAGKTYYVGFDHSSTDRTEWKYVIWKVE